MISPRVMTRPPPRSDNVEEAAALWYARMTSDLKTPADQAAFDAWLKGDPKRSEIYAEICALSGRFELLAGRAELASLKVDAQILEEHRRSFLARFGGALAGAGLASAAAVGAFVVLGNDGAQREHWTTRAGEILEVTLNDGSMAVLGPNTRLEAAYLNNQRLLEIARGQAYFDVAHDARRPFVVSTAGRTIVALGTAFDVRSFRDDLTITLVRGRVAVARLGEAPEAVLDPGEQFRAAFGRTSVSRVNAEAELAWRTGVYDFRDVQLSEAVARFNQGADVRLIVSDAYLSSLRVSGVFRADDPAGFAAALAPAYPIQARRLQSGDILLERTP